MRVTRSADVTTSAPALRTISTTPAGMRSRYGTASPAEYSIATRLPETCFARNASRLFHELYVSLLHSAGQWRHGPCSIACVSATGVPLVGTNANARRDVIPS